MTLPTIACDKCEGLGKDPEARNFLGLLADGTLNVEHYPLDRTRERGEVESCVQCRGYGYRAKHDAYRSDQAFKAGRTRGTAKLCDTCRGSGQGIFAPIVRDCYPCSGRGTVAAWSDDVEPVLPTELSLYDNAPVEFIIGWLRAATITVARQGRSLTWGESFLGLGTVYAVGSYATGSRTDAELIEDVESSLLHHRTQLIKITEQATRRVGLKIVVNVTTNGYTVTVADAPQERPVLPPTYTPELLNRPTR